MAQSGPSDQVPREVDNMEGLPVVFFLIIGLFLFLAIGVPVAFSLGLASIVGMLLFLSPVHLFQIAQISFTRGTEFLFIVAPPLYPYG